ncbi:hypothetical protein [Propionibacterium sp. oral taxon 192]|uniref:hypothetical protein n=1 Tax=Propionibacterium sp. oral taxon 192 TaxID=671222 RepID=UPI0012EB10A3|nr:hypothetical protein [Propionibacterium sp. oral taxon 192]
MEREILSDGSTATGDDFPIVESPLGSLGLVLGPDFWLIEPVRIQCLKGAELLLVSGAITGSRRAAQVAAIWGIATINTVGIAFAGSLGCGALGGSSIAMPEGFVGRLEEEDAVVEGDWSRDTIVRVREPDLQFQQTMWFGLWSRRPSLYRTLTEVDFSGDERIGMQKCDCEVEA